MGILDWVQSRYAQQERPGLCAEDFKQKWSAFVDCFVDSVHAREMPATPPPDEVSEPPTVLPAAERLVAIGDLHGDIEKTRQAFRLGGLTDEKDKWVGGDTVCVQVGDQLDRGDHEIQILYFLERLQREAKEAGGALHVINGNHETMNMAGRFRYCTQGAMKSFLRWNLMQSVGQSLKSRCDCSMGNSRAGDSDGFPQEYTPLLGSMARWAALRPGGPVARRFMARNSTVLQVGSTVFVHGGILPSHVNYGLDRINRETQEWMLGSGPSQRIPRFLAGQSAVVWSRDYSNEDEQYCRCDKLQEALSMIPGAKRMVVGHTIQEVGINSACDQQVFRIDVGMSSGCGDNDVQVLEIRNDVEVQQLSRAQNAPWSIKGLFDTLTRGPVPS
ncbi:hypothetical protein BSKO_14027 [Bryopsis sp. KO-2023]|nr:hypothetical protein BSKO_14027 [Bryopsis sp. KO-2023]